MKRKSTEADILLWEQLKEIPGYEPSREYPFYMGRKWRFDFAIGRVAIEIEGGAFTQGRHTRGAGFVKDLEKYNFAALDDWRVLRFTPQQVLKGEAIAFIKRVLSEAP